ncbi:baeRF2 domain-containing protein [Bounagaea algeriensis]
MDLARLRPVYEHEGPFATVYLEGRSPGEDAAQQVRLRWKGLREELASEGATAPALDAIESALDREEAGEEQGDGRVLVAVDAGLVFDEPWDAALGTGDHAHWTRLPELAAYVREEARSVRALVAVVDQEGAQIRQEVCAAQHTAREFDVETVEGGASEGVHKPRGGALSHNQIQRRAEEAVQRNVNDIVERLNALRAEFRPRLLVLAGEVQARSALRDELPSELADLLVETGSSGRDGNASEEALAEQLSNAASEHSAGAAEARAEELNAGLAHGNAVHGSDAVAQAAEMGAVATLLFEHGRPATREAFLLRACAGTSSDVDLVTGGTNMADGVGALLRFPLNG